MKRKKLSVNDAIKAYFRLEDFDNGTIRVVSTLEGRTNMYYRDRLILSKLDLKEVRIHFYYFTKQEFYIAKQIAKHSGFDMKITGNRTKGYTASVSDGYNKIKRKITNSPIFSIRIGMLDNNSFQKNIPFKKSKVISNKKMYANNEFYNFIKEGKGAIIDAMKLEASLYPLLADKHPNYLGVSRDDRSKLSYLDDKKIKRTLENYGLDGYEFYNGDNRYHAKPAKAIRKLFKNPDMFTAQDYEYFTRQWNLFFYPNEFAELVVKNPSEIGKWYNEEHHYNDKGTLSDSCMRDKPESYFEIYEDNADGILLMIDENDKVYGRALLWTTNCGTKIMDRVYYNSEDVREAFFNWAKDNNYTRKRYQSHSDREYWVNPEGEEFSKIYNIDSVSDDYDYYPYVDTFSYFDGSCFSNEQYNDAKELNSLDGGYEGGMCCYNCGDNILEGYEMHCHEEGETYCEDCASYSEEEQDVVPHSETYSEYHNEYIFDFNAVFCEYKEVNFHKDCEDFYYSEYEQDYLHIDDSAYCEYKDIDVLIENTVYSEWEDDNLLTEDAVKVQLPDGGTDWLLEENSVFSNELEANIIKDEAIETEEGEYVYEIED